MGSATITEQSAGRCMTCSTMWVCCMERSTDTTKQISLHHLHIAVVRQRPVHTVSPKPEHKVKSCAHRLTPPSLGPGSPLGNLGKRGSGSGLQGFAGLRISTAIPCSPCSKLSITDHKDFSRSQNHSQDRNRSSKYKRRDLMTNRK